MPAWPVVDAVLPGAPGPPFQPDELGQELRVPEEIDFERPGRRQSWDDEENCDDAEDEDWDLGPDEVDPELLELDNYDLDESG